MSADTIADIATCGCITYVFYVLLALIDWWKRVEREEEEYDDSGRTN